MCTGIVETAEISGSGKGQLGWFKLGKLNVSYDHPFHAPLEHALNIDFVNEEQTGNTRIAVELNEESAKRLVQAIVVSLSRGGIDVRDIARTELKVAPTV